MMRRAIIDIGTNSVKLLIAEVEEGSVRPLWERSEQTRLGQGFYDTHRLKPEAIAHTAEAVGRFAAKAAEWEVVSTRVIATSAARDAINQKELLHAVQTACGLSVEVISGDQEAAWVFTGVRTDPALAEKSLLIMDVGGGSTEFILGRGGRQEFRQSYPIGTVRLLEQLRPADPPAGSDWQKCHHWLGQYLADKVVPMLQPHMDTGGHPPLELVGTGGTTSILAAMELRLTAFDRQRIEQTILARDQVRRYQELLWSLPLTERQKIPGLPPNRADVILFGVAVFLIVMEQLGFERVRISTRGLRFAAVAA